MGRTVGLFLKELSHDFSKITAPWISTAHITEIPTVLNVKQSRPAASLTKKLGHRKRPGFKQVSWEKGLTSI